MKYRALSADQSNEAWFLPQHVLPVPFFPQQSWQEADHLHIYQGIASKYLKDLDLWHLNQKQLLIELIGTGTKNMIHSKKKKKKKRCNWNYSWFNTDFFIFVSDTCPFFPCTSSCSFLHFSLMPPQCLWYPGQNITSSQFCTQVMEETRSVFNTVTCSLERTSGDVQHCA